MTRMTTFVDAEAVGGRGGTKSALQIQHAREQRGVAHLALSGGTTPARAYELLAEDLGDWEDVELWFADERCVHAQDEQSNYRMVADTLLEAAGVFPRRVHRMEGERGPEEGARRYAEALCSAHGSSSVERADAGLPVLDLIVLGIGPDGHVASLFPGASTLQADEQEICLGVHDSPKPPPERITLSLGVLRAARRCLLLATGASKADAIAAALAEPSTHVPASLLRRERLTVFVDDAACPAPVRG
jgi:6-phosphogluconolactonase